MNIHSACDGMGYTAAAQVVSSRINTGRSQHCVSVSSSSSGNCSSSSSSGSSSRSNSSNSDGSRSSLRRSSTVSPAVSAPISRAMYNLQHREKIFKRKRKSNVVDIDGPQFRSESYDPSYGWSIWTNERKLELPVGEPSRVWNGQSSLSTPAPTPTVAPFTSRQPELDDSMRCALLGWLSEVATEYKMQTPTYFLCVRLLDTVLQQQPIRQSKFQLLGCACLLIAGKLEEMESPTIENLVHLADSSFDTESLVKMEHTVLCMLDFKVSVHTSYYFATRLALAAEMTEKEQSFMFFLLEISLNDFSLSYEPRSKVAAAAAHLTIQSLRALDAPVWSLALEHYSGYSDADPTLRALILRIRQLHWTLESSPYAALGKKYAKPSRHRVSLTGALRADNIRYSSSKRPTKEEEEEEEEEATEGAGEGEEVVVVEVGRVEVVRQEERVEERVQDKIGSMDYNIDAGNNLKLPAKEPVSHQNSNSVIATSDVSASKAVSAAHVTHTHTNNNTNRDTNNNSNSNNNTNANININNNSNTRKQGVHDRVRYEAKMRYSASDIKNRIPLKIAESAGSSSSEAHHDHHVAVAERVTATASVLTEVAENVQDSRTASQPPRSVTVRAPSVRYIAPTPASSTVQNQLCEVSADGARADDRDGRDGRGDRGRVPVEHPLSLLSSLQTSSIQGQGRTHPPSLPAPAPAPAASVAAAPAVLPATVTTSAVASAATAATVAVIATATAAAVAGVVTAGVTKGGRGRKRTAEALKPALYAVPTVSKSKKFWNSPAPTQSLTTTGPVNNALSVSGPEDKQTASWAPLSQPLPLPLPPSTVQSSTHPHRSASLPVVSAYKVEETVPKMRQEGKLHVSASSLKVAFDDEHEHVTDTLQQPQRRVGLRNRK